MIAQEWREIVVPRGMQPLRVLLVDDNVFLLDTIRRLLSLSNRVEVAGAVTSGKAALSMSKQLNVDLVLMDMDVCDQSGLTIAKQIKALPNAPRIILLTLFDAEAYRTVGASRVVDGYLDKADLATMLPPLINALMAA